MGSHNLREEHNNTGIHITDAKRQIQNYELPSLAGRQRGQQSLPTCRAELPKGHTDSCSGAPGVTEKGEKLKWEDFTLNFVIKNKKICKDTLLILACR